MNWKQQQADAAQQHRLSLNDEVAILRAKQKAKREAIAAGKPWPPVTEEVVEVTEEVGAESESKAAESPVAAKAAPKKSPARKPAVKK